MERKISRSSVGNVEESQTRTNLIFRANKLAAAAGLIERGKKEKEKKKMMIIELAAYAWPAYGHTHVRTTSRPKKVSVRKRDLTQIFS